MKRMLHCLISTAALVLFATGCITNPVTGKKELRVVSTAMEVGMGKKGYLPAQQAQGGSYETIPSVTKYVNEIGQKLAKVSDRPDLPYEFVVLNNNVPNAWAMPGGKISINRGLLLEMKDEAELAAVLAHEIVHAAAGHGAQNMQRSVAGQALMVGAGIALHDNQYKDLLVQGGQMGMMLGMMKYSRNAERDGDLYSMKYLKKAGYDTQAAVDLQQTFVEMKNRDGKGGSDSGGWLGGLFLTHPPSEERVANNRAALATYPPGGKRNRERYLHEIQPILENQEAYDSIEQGYAALKKGDSRSALRYAANAKQIEPRESHAYGLASKANLSAGNYREGLQNVEQALDLNPNYYEFHLIKGKLAEQLGDKQTAQRHLAQSQKLLPTATAAQALGLMAWDSGNQRSAINYWQQAAGSNSPAGRDAKSRLIKIQKAMQAEEAKRRAIQAERARRAAAAAGQ